MSGGATVHVVGAGLAGLSCAVRLVGRGVKVVVYEASSRAGGRCRSFHDRVLDRLIDNGNHILLAGNRAVNEYLAAIGATDALTTIRPACFPFLDLESGERWEIRPNTGRLPWWLLVPARRPPGLGLRDLMAVRALATLPHRWPLGVALHCSPAALRRFWEPLAVAVLNTPFAEGDARLLWEVMRETFLRGEEACRPRLAPHGLGAAFVAPAEAHLRARGGEIRFATPVRGIEFSGSRASGLGFDGEVAALGPADQVILAVPPRNARRLLPELQVPMRMRAIINGHFLIGEPRPEGGRFLGLIGGFAQWVFVRGDVASVTISAGDAIADLPNQEIAARMWNDVSRALGITDRALPPHRIVKEKTATIDQTPASVVFRPPAATRWCNVTMAGDWTDTGLPATVEGAIRSGFLAADRVTTSN